MWALLMYQFYSASIVGSLLVEAPRFINTPEDVLHSNLEVGAEDIAYNHDFFRVKFPRSKVNKIQKKNKFNGFTKIFVLDYRGSSGKEDIR